MACICCGCVCGWVWVCVWVGVGVWVGGCGCVCGGGSMVVDIVPHPPTSLISHHRLCCRSVSAVVIITRQCSLACARHMWREVRTACIRTGARGLRTWRPRAATGQAPQTPTGRLLASTRTSAPTSSFAVRAVTQAKEGGKHANRQRRHAASDGAREVQASAHSLARS